MKLILVLFLLTDLFTVSRSNFVIYSTGKGELRIKRVKTSETVKVIKTEIDEIKGGLAIDFRNDIIFYADGNNIYKIYLVSDVGKRSKTGRGELFLNPSVDHFETQLFGGEHYIEGLHFDDGSGQLFFSWNDKLNSGLYTIDPDNGTVRNVFNAEDCIPLRSPVVFRNNVYFTCPFYGYKRSLYKSALKKYSRENVKTGKDVNVTAFTVDRDTKRAFYAQRSTIRMFDPHPYKGIIIADSEVTNGVRALAVYGQYVLWSSIKLKKIFIGKLDKDMYFIPKRNVQVIDGSDDDPIKAHHIALF